MQPKSSKRFETSCLFNYWCSGRAMFERESHVCVSLDAGRIFGEDLLMSVLWASGAERGCWAPPQARFFFVETRTRQNSSFGKVTSFSVTFNSRDTCLGGRFRRTW